MHLSDFYNECLLFPAARQRHLQAAAGHSVQLHGGLKESAQVLLSVLSWRQLGDTLLHTNTTQAAAKIRGYG